MTRTRGGRIRNAVREESDAKRTESDERDARVNKNEDSEEVEKEDEVTEESLSHVSFHFKQSKWLKICKIATRCDLKKTVEYLELTLEAWELAWFKNHPQFRHYFHMLKDENRIVHGNVDVASPDNEDRIDEVVLVCCQRGAYTLLHCRACPS